MIAKKDYKGYIFVIVAICAVMLIPLLIQLVNSQTKAVINLKMPDGYEIGELIILDASASKADEIIWQITPLTPNFKVVGKTALFSSTEPIDYTIVVVARRDKDLDCRIFTLKYGKKKVIEEVTTLTDFDQSVKSWLGNLSAPQNRGAALRLAQSFRIIARTIESGVYENIDGIIMATAYANSDALGQNLEAWKPFLRNFQNYLENDPPITVKDHAAVWYDMAIALEKIFGAPC